jgi:23S rRNA (guanosine2251-2'-O)-methyltransferase
MKKIILILDNIRSVHNVGSLFRTADGFGISEIFLCGTTPSPIDRFGRQRSDFHKVSLGAEKTMSWKYFETTELSIEFARREGFEIVAIEQNEKSQNIEMFSSEKNIALVLGTEVTGVSQNILETCDVILEIPMKGNKESFNVSIAGAIAMYELSKNKKTA